MKGFILIKSHPYMAKTDANGKFVIKNIPAGEHVFQFWHEQIGYLKNVSFETNQLNEKGRLTLIMKPDLNDLGEAKLGAKRFLRTTIGHAKKAK